MALRAVMKKLLPAGARQRLRAALDVANTEWHFRLRRGPIRARLEELRRLGYVE